MQSSSVILDFLFIILLATLYQLSRSSPFAAIDAEPAKLGAQHAAAVHADDVVSLAVTADALIFDDRPFATLDELPPEAQPSARGSVLLLPRTQDITHHRMIDVYAQIADRGWPVQIGVTP